MCKLLQGSLILLIMNQLDESRYLVHAQNKLYGPTINLVFKTNLTLIVWYKFVVVLPEICASLICLTVHTDRLEFTYNTAPVHVVDNKVNKVLYAWS